MNRQRRLAAKALVAATLAPFATAWAPGAFASAATNNALGARNLTTTPGQETNALHVIMPKTCPAPLTGEAGRSFRYALSKAIIDTIATNYAGQNLPIWHKPLASINLEKRVVNICYWLVKSVQAHRTTYPVDPTWVAAQIMTESFFNEFAVSSALAVGICQFIPPTATAYGMVWGGSVPAHAKAPYATCQWATEADHYYTHRKAWKRAIRTRDAIAGNDQTAYLRQVLAGNKGAKAKAKKWLSADAKAKALRNKVNTCKQHYQRYLQENFKGRSIFNEKDVAFFKTFDQRVLYRAPVDAMVRMLAHYLRARNGNLLVAAAGYHCGLKATSEGPGIYRRYGRIPNIASTATYVSRILVNHHEIASRLHTA